ncbi:hypothetical protein P691DRAFT_771474 [Macrolepiota fuliginosa MF-IS2]|uniref:Arrestin-like N-terminal domain-containing protein n=1 Tax=Macrolepiota fuliginosa MF-IS2 TaxID=1400762 RepID=A0A9P6C917_9AGAR|nr:hypothetical protein P691DRAFT_771474 [Macrolepiota fuliginosa MF-IS2]
MSTTRAAFSTPVTLDPPEYTEDGEYSPMSAHFEESHTSFPLMDSSSNSGRYNPLPVLLSHRCLHEMESRTPPPSTTRIFTYNIQRKGKAWAELKVAADKLMSKNTPTFIEGSRIEGEVNLYATRPENIHSLIVYAKGQVITGAHNSEQLTFFETSQTIWSKSKDEPRKRNSRPSPERTPSPSGTDKLHGTFTWPFCLEIPREVVVASKATRGEPRVYRPPESFFERHERASVRYEICVRFVRGYFKPDDRIHATFGYIPLTIPKTPSALRQIAYEQGTPLLGPQDDPDGWHECKTVKLKGRIFHQREAEVYCTLLLAKPLTYTRGAVIPCWLLLRSNNTQALDLLATPKAVVTRLRRCVKAAADQTKAVENINWRDQTELSELGIWWPAGGSRYTREMSGELHLKIDLKPSSAMAHFRIEYSVVLFPFDTPDFEVVDTAPLIKQPVEIVTGYAPGPRPRMYAPPEYESPDTVVVDSQYHQMLTTGFA